MVDPGILRSALPDPRFAAFLAVMAVLIVIPGPDMAMVTRQVLAGGRRRGSATAIGTAAGSALWAAASALGVGLLLERSVAAFTIFKLAGAVFLAGLGLRTLLRRGTREDPPAPRGRGRGGPFLQGLAGNLLNPKAGAIFALVFPQFVVPGDPPLRLLAMLLAYELLLVAWLNLYALALDSAGRSAAGRRVRTALERASGAVLVGLGLRLALERR
jgi:threonine/homoserine/homoserine lactone efflux protein